MPRGDAPPSSEDSTPVSAGALESPSVPVASRKALGGMRTPPFPETPLKDEVRRRQETRDAFLKAVLDLSKDIVYRTDQTGRILEISPAVARLGRDPQTLIGRDVGDLFHPADRERRRREITERRAGDRRTVDVEVRLLSAERARMSETELAKGFFSGDPVFLLSAKGVYDDPEPSRESFRGTVGVIRDVTQVKRLEAEVRRKERSQTGAAEAKGRFLSDLSRELRTPLQGVIGMTRLLFENEDRPDRREMLGAALAAARGLAGAMNGLLELAALEAGHLAPSEKPFTLAQILAELGEQFELAARKKGLVFTLAVEPDVPPKLVGDQSRIAFILANLLDNAVKYTFQGEVELVVSAMRLPIRTLEQSPRASILFTVRDTGVGIDEARQEQIFSTLSLTFDPFAENSSLALGGFGPAVCRRLAAALGGRLWLESEPGKGAAFFLLLPLAAAD